MAKLFTPLPCGGVRGRVLNINTMEIIAICCDHAGYELKKYVLQWLEENGYEYNDFGCYSPESIDYADVAHPMAAAIEAGEYERGIAICGSGNGISMTLNKHQGIRAALCWCPEIAELGRQHNNANVLVMPGRFVTNTVADRILKKFFKTPFEGGRHARRIEKIPCC